MKHFKCVISVDNPLVSHHRIDGACVLPGVAYLDLCARCLNATNFVLTKIHYHNALVIADGKDIELHMDYNEQSKKILIYHWQNSHRIVHFEADQEDLDDVSERTLNGNEYESASIRHVSMQEIYRLAANFGITHGMFMQVLGDTTVDSQQIKMNIELGVVARPYLEQFYLHSALLDGATFAIAALYFTNIIQLEPNHLYLPLSIDKVEVHQRIISHKITVLAEKQPAADGFIKCNLSLFDSDGRLIVHFGGLCNKKFQIRKLFEFQQHTTPINNIFMEQSLEKQILIILSNYIDEKLIVESRRVSFFDLGLDSSQLMSCAAQIETALDIHIYPTLLFEYNTFDKLLAQLASELNKDVVPNQTDVIKNDDATSAKYLQPSTARSYYLYRQGLHQLHLPKNNAMPLNVLRRDIEEECLSLGGHSLDLTYMGVNSKVGVVAAVSDLISLIKQVSSCPYCLIIQVSTQQKDLFAALCGLVLSFNKESTQLQLKLLMSDEIEVNFAARLVNQIDCIFEYKGNQCYVPTRQKVTLAAVGSLLKRGGRYLIVGGGNGLSKLLRSYLLQKYSATLAVIGHRTCDSTCQAQGINYQQININDEIALREYLEGEMPFDGIFFLAGTKCDSFLVNTDTRDIDSVFSIKPMAFQTLLKSLDGSSCAFVCAFSSLSAEIGQAGQSVYAAANSVLNYIATSAEAQRAASGRGPKISCISWPYWQEGGMQLSPDLVEHFTRQYKSTPLHTSEGLDLLEEALRCSDAHIMVANENLFHFGLKANLHEGVGDSQPGHSFGEFEDSDIAIIGVSFALPGSNDFDKLHYNLSSGQSSIQVANRPWSAVPYAWGGYLSDIDQFDPLHFNISPNEAKVMDPQERLFLSHAWHCLEDGGYASKRGQSIGVIAAAMFNGYQNFAIENHNTEQYPQSILASIANRVSYTCNLTGPSFSIDSMCSSAFSALDLACQTLKNDDISAVLVGAVNLCSHPYKLAALVDHKFLSPNGLSMPFCAKANGYVPGEGVVVLLLKKAKHAVAHKDNIYGVIKAVASGHGGLSRGFTVPSATTQAQIISKALMQANLANSDIDYLEAHGTGTVLGDPIEVEGLHQVFASRGKPLYFGSIKGNIGHLEPVAGFASLIKVLCQFRHNAIYPSINAIPLNEAIESYSQDLQVATELQDDVTMRFAGISCFGAGGSNTHCIVQNFQRHETVYPKTHYKTQSYWLDNPVRQLHPQILQHRFVESPYTSCLNESLLIYQEEVKQVPRYFNIEKVNASAILYIISITDCWEQSFISKLLRDLAEKPSLRIIILSQCRTSCMMIHSLIASSNKLKSAWIKCIYIESFLSLETSQVYTVLASEFNESEHRVVYFNKQLKRFTPEFNLFHSPSLELNLGQIRGKKIAVFGGLGALGMQFCLALHTMGVNDIHVYGQSPVAHKSKELALLHNQVQYIAHDFSATAYPAGRYDVIVNCMGSMPKKPLINVRQRQLLKSHYKQFIEEARPSKLISISSLSALVGFADEPEYALDNAFVHAMTNLCIEHVILYCPLILTPNAEQWANETWLTWSEKNQGLSPFPLSEFRAICPKLLALPAGEYIPFLGNTLRLQEYLQQSFQVPRLEKSQTNLEKPTDSLLTIVEDLLGLPTHEIDCEKSLQELGFNSLTLAEFAQRISLSYKINFNPSQFFEIRSLDDLNASLQVQNSIQATGSFDNKKQNESVVICGYECQFADSENAQAFWRNLEKGQECTHMALKERFADLPIEGNMGFISNVDSFDHKFFDISTQEAKWIDPQQRKLLELSWHVFENAGIAPSSLRGESVGVFVAIQFDDYARLADRQNSTNIYQVTGCAKNFSANRLSHYYDFCGPSESIDTACSSGLSALDRAVQSILLMECKYALVLSVSLLCCPKTFELTRQMQILSPDGHCRPFDINAAGYVKGEGIAGLLITKQSVATDKHWRIDGIISGLAVNHGGRSQSLTAPNGLAQQAVMQKVYQNTGILPEKVDYIEAHATATKLGDPVEYRAISAVFNQAETIGIGSVKANIGHTEPVAGLAGIIKALKMLDHQKIPKQINFTHINQYIDLKSPFYITTETISKPLNHIGINSFGFGGSNGHCVISRATQESKHYKLPYNLLVISAKTNDSLIRLQSRWYKFLQANPDVDLTAVCKSLAVGREHFAFRRCWVAQSVQDLIEQFNNIPNWSQGSKRDSFSPLKQLSEDKLLDELNEIASIYMKNHAVDWMTLYQGIESLPVVLPNYSFELSRHWLDDTVPLEKQQQSPSLQIYVEEWQPCALQFNDVDPTELFLFIVHDSLRKNVESLISDYNLPKTSMVIINEHYQKNLAVALTERPKYIYYLGNISYTEENPLESEDHPYQRELLYLLQSTQNHLQAVGVSFYFISCNPTKGNSNQSISINPTAAAMYGFVQSFSKEIPEFRYQCIQISSLEFLPNILNISCKDANLYHFDGQMLFTRKLILTAQEMPSASISHKIIVLVGGNGQVGQQLLPEFLKFTPAQCICLSRTRDGLSNNVIHYPVDCTDKQAFLAVINEIIERYQRIDYLIHLSSRYEETSIENLDYTNYLMQMKAKVLGTKHCLIAAEYEAVKQTVICSSVQVYTQNENRGAYTAACMYSDALVQQHNSEKVILLHWGFWQQPNLTLNSDMQAAGIHPINGEQGVAALLKILIATQRNFSCFLIDNSIKRFMPISEEANKELLPAIQFHQRMQQLENYSANAIWSQLISGGAITFNGKQAQVNTNFVSAEYQFYVSKLIDLLAQFEQQKNRKLAVLNAEQLALQRWHNFSKDSVLQPFLNLVDHCVSSLPSVLNTKVTPLEILFPNGQDELVRNVYQNNPVADFYNYLVAKAVHKLCDQNPSLKILELGAGTGATTAQILIDGYQDLDYTFTDISDDLIERARIRFANFSNLQFSRFDIDHDIESNGYDLIIASNVLHACENLPATLLRINETLRPGGYLIINEVVQTSLFLSSTFGMLPQWHQQKSDTRSAGEPLLNQQAWQKYLKQAGFILSSCQGPEWIEQVVMTAQLERKHVSPLKHPDFVPLEPENLLSTKGKTKSSFGSFRQLIADALKVAPEAIDRKRSMKSYGLDSLAAINLMQEINQFYGLNLSPTHLLQETSIEQFLISNDLEYES